MWMTRFFINTQNGYVCKGDIGVVFSGRLWRAYRCNLDYRWILTPSQCIYTYRATTFLTSACVLLPLKIAAFFFLYDFHFKSINPSEPCRITSRCWKVSGTSLNFSQLHPRLLSVSSRLFPRSSPRSLVFPAPMLQYLMGYDKPNPTSMVHLHSTKQSKFNLVSI